MSERISKPRTRVTKNTRTEAHKDSRAHREAQKAKEELAAELDDVLDDIDAVLQENAEEFVKGFVQKGGE